MKKYVILMAVLGIMGIPSSYAQDKSILETFQALDSNQLAILVTLGTFLGVIVLLLILMVYLMTFLSSVLRKENPQLAAEPGWWDSFKERFVTGDVEKELASEKLMNDHSYDGIQELDNFMPPWLQYVFSGTILFAVVYFSFYTIFGFGKTGIEEYEEELQIAALEAEVRGASALASLDETNVEVDGSATGLSSGQTIFEANCAACHAIDGGGGIGPNLTDEYWLHGGSIRDVFTVVKYGVIEKGMVPWEDQLNPQEIQQVSSYILSLKGTSPAVPKASQGELYTEGEKVSQPEGAGVTDEGAAVQADSATIVK